MPYQPNTPDQINARMAAAGEAAFADVAPDGVDASSANAPLAAVYRSPAQAIYLDQLALAAQVQDFWLDSCAEDLVLEQAARLGLVQAAAQASGGGANPAAGAVPGTPIPQDATLGGGLYRVATATTMTGTGTEVVPLVAVSAGTAGDRAAGTVLELDSPIGGLAAQTLTVDAGGLTGGSAHETLEQLRTRAIAWRRRRPRGGCPGDYRSWVQAIYPNAIVLELPLWAGLGRVGVAVAFPGRAATSTELGRIEDALVAQAPLDAAAITVIAATVTPLPLEVAVLPDTTAVRAAVVASYASFLATEPGIGGTVDYSRLREAISSAAGEYKHRLIDPTGDVAPGATEMFTPGPITWAAWS